MPRKNSPRRPNARTNQAQASTTLLRIIGGEWRSRKLPFPAVEGLRPTPDRVRETLFNWLQHHVGGARCLDMFAGSGALGLEALSRGAESALFIDQSSIAARQLKDNLITLKCQRADIINTAAATWLTQQQAAEEAQYDLVFLDPPFRKGMVEPICQQLDSLSLLSDHAMIYIETEAELAQLTVPANWHLHREKKAGQVIYRLYQRELLS